MNSWLALELLSGAAIAAALVCCRLGRRLSPSLRHTVIAATLLTTLALPLATSIPVTTEIELLPRLSLPLTGAASERDVLPANDTLVDSSISSLSQDLVRSRDGESAPAQGRGGAMPRARGDGWTGASLGSWLATIYVVGLLLLSLRLLLSVLAARRLTKRAAPLETSSPWLEALERINAPASGHSSRASLRSSDSIQFPATCGFLSPLIIVPDSSLDWSSERCSSVLLHELAHIRRGDWLLSLLGRLSCAVHWYNPLMWKGWREMQALAEEASDDAVVLEGVRAESYARHLVEAARELRSATFTRPVPAEIAFSISSSTGLPRRIDRLTAPELERRHLPTPAKWLVSSFVVSLIVVLASVRLVQAQPTLEQDFDRDSIERAHRAAERGDLATVEELLGYATSVNEVLPGDGTLLIAATRSGRRRVVEQLLDHGADPNLVAEGDGTALLVAAERGDLELMVLLMERGADVDREAPGDGNPLIAAARAGQLEASMLLLDAGADVDRVVLGDETPLIQAAGEGHLEIARLLLERGADPNLTVFRDSDGRPLRDGPRSPLGEARRGGFANVVDLLQEYGAR